MDNNNDNNDNINLLSNMYSQAIITKTRINDDDDARKFYLGVIDQDNGKEQLITIARKIADDIKNSNQNHENQVATDNDNQNNQIIYLSIAMYNKIIRSTIFKVFQLQIGHCFAIGTKEWCDLQINHNDGISRLHCMIIPYIQEGIIKLVVMDIGSYYGIKICNNFYENAPNHNANFHKTTDRIPLTTQVGTDLDFTMGYNGVKIISSLEDPESEGMYRLFRSA